jgi:hypothetical protein
MYDYKNDPYGKECLRLARKSKSIIGFGAVLVKDGEIIGRGWNRRSISDERAMLSHIDYAIHAEQACIIDAIKGGYDVVGCEVYVLGLVLRGPRKETMTIRTVPTFVCSKCPHTFIRFNTPVNIPYIHGWYQFSPEMALEVGKQVANKGVWGQFVAGGQHGFAN